MKAIILRNERAGVYVMDRGGCFRFIRGYVSLPVGSEIEVKPLPARHLAKAAAMIACLVLIVALGSFGWLWNIESYSVYVDINPSVELVFNAFNRLKDAKPLNGDGVALLDGLRLKGSPGDAVVRLTKEAASRGYLASGSSVHSVSIAVAARAGKAPQEYVSIILAALEENGLRDIASVEVCGADIQNKAEELGCSPGKLKLVEQLFAVDQSLTADEAMQMPVGELMEAIGEAEAEQTGDAEGSTANSTSKNSGETTAASGAEVDDSSGDNVANPNAGPGNNSGGGNSTNPNAGPGNNSGNGNADNPNAGPGNNSGNGNVKNPNAGPDNNSGGGNPTNPNAGPGNNSGGGNTKNPNAGPGNNSGKGKSGSPDADSGDNGGGSEEFFSDYADGEEAED